jgi:hypothetical protein
MSSDHGRGVETYQSLSLKMGFLFRQVELLLAKLGKIIFKVLPGSFFFVQLLSLPFDVGVELVKASG